jgi:hypothetical protein
MYPKRRAPSTSRRAARRALVTVCLLGVLAPASAQATPYVNVSPSLMSATGTVAVGDVGQGQLIVMNHSTAPEDAGLLLLNELTLVPSCGVPLADPACTLSPGIDPGVIAIDGAIGSGACAGNSFTVVTSATGRVSFAPTLAVRLSSTGASGTCIVTFSYTVQKVATKDSSPAAGIQTDLVAFARATASLNGKETIGVGYETDTVVRDTPELTTRASAGVPVGSQVSVAGTLAGTHPDGSITFDLFGPTDATCSATPLSSATLPVNGNGTYHSQSVVASQPGTYRWRASYGGDEDNDAVSSACSEPSAATTVSPLPTPPPPPPPPPSGGGGSTPGGGTTPGTGGTDGAGKGKPPGIPVTTPVRLDGFGLTRRTFTRASTSTALAATAATAKKKKAKKAAGTTIRYTVSAPATVTIVVERTLKGRRSGSKCVKATAKLKRMKSCTRYVKASTLTRVHTTAGAKKVLFSGRVGRRAMAYGTYRMRATAIAVGGTASSERKVTFKIVKG